MDKQILGWREWVSLPNLGIEAIKAKVDTGARTSALHAFSLETFQENGVLKVRFGIHPLQISSEKEIYCISEVVDQRSVSDSGGHKESRYFIRTLLSAGNVSKEIEISLTNRENMRFRMLLGRTAMAQSFIVDPQLSYATGTALRDRIFPEYLGEKK